MQTILLVVSNDRFHVFWGVGVYVILCIYYHAYLIDWGKKLDLDQYYSDHNKWEWQFETDERGKWKWSGRKIIADET